MCSDLTLTLIDPNPNVNPNPKVGAGKSVFSRAFIREVLGDETYPVPSPTFLLQVRRVLPPANTSKPFLFLYLSISPPIYIYIYTHYI